MGGFPALMIRPPESPIQQLGQVEQLKAAVQENQLRAQQISDQKALTQAMTGWDGKDYNQLPMLVLRSGGSGQAALAMSQQVLGIKAKSSEIARDDSVTAQNNAKVHIDNMDEARGKLLSINGLPMEQRQGEWDSEVTAAEQKGLVPEGQITHQYPGEQQSVALANTLALGSKLQEEANKRQELAQNAWKSVGGALINTVTGERIGGLSDINTLNQGLQTRWQVLHRGEPLPDQFRLKPNDSPADFDRIDKLLEATEKGQATKAQQDTVNAIRQQTYQLSVEKEGFNWVSGVATKGPSAGKVVAAPVSDIANYGIQSPGKMEGNDIRITQSGRQWLTLANKQAPANAPPDQKGIGQLIDELDADGKLGPLAGRWNEFLAGKFGEGDAEYTALRTKLDLSNTLLATVHSGRLGPFLMENMQQLASAGKMDGNTLKAAFNSEKDYVGDRAMDPNPPTNIYRGEGAATTKAFQHTPGGKAKGLKEGQTGTGDDGKKYIVKGGVWVAQP